MATGWDKLTNNSQGIVRKYAADGSEKRETPLIYVNWFELYSCDERLTYGELLNTVIFSSEEYCLRVARLMSLTIFSDDLRPVPVVYLMSTPWWLRWARNPLLANYSIWTHRRWSRTFLIVSERAISETSVAKPVFSCAQVLNDVLNQCSPQSKNIR